MHTHMHTYIHTQLHVQATIHEQIPWMLSISANAFPPPDHISCTAVTKRWGLLSYATKQKAVERQDLIGRSASQRQSISSCSCPLCKHTHKFTLTTCSYLDAAMYMEQKTVTNLHLKIFTFRKYLSGVWRFHNLIFNLPVVWFVLNFHTNKTGLRFAGLTHRGTEISTATFQADCTNHQPAKITAVCSKYCN